MNRKEFKAMEKFYEANKDKQCELCGCGLGEVALFEVHKIMDSEMVFDGETIILCHNCMTGVDFIEFFDSVRVKYVEKEIGVNVDVIKALLPEAIKDEPEKFLILKEGVIYDFHTDKPSVRNIDKGMTDEERSSYLIHLKSKPHLCQICKLIESCQNNFDYDCIEASDFLLGKDIVFTIKDAFLDSLIDKDHNALRG